MRQQNNPQPKSSVANSGVMVGNAIGDENLVETGNVTINEQHLKQSGLPAELAVALVEALKGIQASGLSEALKKAAITDHAGLIDEQPVEPLAHLVLGALTEGGLLIGRSDDRETARREVRDSLDRLLRGLRRTGG